MKLAHEVAGLERDGITELGLSGSVSASINIMDRLFQTLHPVATIDHKLHLCLLTVQVLCLGLVLYSQGHAGKLYPIFLADPLVEVTLRGSLTNLPSIVPERRDLACMRDMVGDQIFVFRMDQHPPESLLDIRLALLASCEEIVDSWGPGYLVMSTDAADGKRLYGLWIRGGVIKPALGMTYGERLFHWGLEFRNPISQSQTFSYWDKILIGAAVEYHTLALSTGGPTSSISNVTFPLVTVEQYERLNPNAANDTLPMVAGSGHHQERTPITTNATCPLITAESRRESEPYLCRLGTAPDSWKLTEVQGLVALNPPYFTVQGAVAMTRQSGRPLKKVLLEQWIREDNLSLFEEPWGLQVSLCTGVTRRVPLRLLIEEPLLRYIDALNVDGWEALRTRAISVIRADHSFTEWSQTLMKGEMQCMRHIFSNLLDILQETGFDQSGKNFSILWPHYSDVRFCVQIRPQKDQLWCSMLRDCEWRATFAVTTSHSVWRLLSTNVEIQWQHSGVEDNCFRLLSAQTTQTKYHLLF